MEVGRRGSKIKTCYQKQSESPDNFRLSTPSFCFPLDLLPVVGATWFEWGTHLLLMGNFIEGRLFDSNLTGPDR